MKRSFILVGIALLFLSPLGVSFAETLEEAWELGLQTDQLLTNDKLRQL